ncbi:class I SAM-dependent methyltransferase [Rhizobium sp. LjRoot30]|uniref:class I SAM-dependent methyltransferase n=1 Tax=Rhizobium sp. LjRoot30 TaxID=3342320 RepID=UPI003ECDDD76
MDMHTCPVCSGNRLTSFLRRSHVPTFQNLVMAEQAAAKSIMRGELDLMACEDCGFVFNRAFALAPIDYDEAYDNTQSYSSFFDDYLNDLVRMLVEEKGVKDCLIVEVGCGKGQFLHKLVSYPGANNRGIGFDPTYVGPDEDLDGRLQFQRRYYDSSCTDIKPDFVVCRHVIEHIPEPRMILKAVRDALDTSPDARVFFETPCVEWILRNRVVWDFFYEHCSIFTQNSLALAFERSGFVVDQVHHIFGGQYLWLEARPTTEPAPAERETTGETAKLATAYGLHEAEQRQVWLERLRELKQGGKVALWGAGAKGATFANLVDPEREFIDCVIDLNPNKQGRFIPGTGHPIVAPASVEARGVASAVLMNPNYREENLRRLADSNIKLALIDWSE